MTTEEAIEQLKAIRSDYRDDLRNHPELVKDDVEALDLAIAALERERWISVKDRLPEPKTDVLVAFDDGEVWAMWQNWANDTNEPFTYSVETFDGPTHDVTHWRALPEPPKEET